MSFKEPHVISISTGTILRTIGILLAIGILWMIRDILLFVFVALLLAGVIYPFARFAAAHKVPKGVAVVLFYVLLFGFLALSFALLVPALYSEAKMLNSSYNHSFDWVTQSISTLQDFTDKYSFTQNLKASLPDLRRYVGQGFTGFLGALTGLFGGIAGIVVVLVLSFYIIVEESAIKTLFQNLIPQEYQQLASHVIWQVINRLGDWLRGQLILGLIIGLVSFVAYSLIGVPYPILLGLFAGLLEFIPYVGPLVAAVPALFMGATVSPFVLLLTLVAIVLIQQFENHVVVPKVMQKAIGLNPIISIVALMIGAELFGLVGALFSIPVATAGSVVISELLNYHKHSSLKSTV